MTGTLEGSNESDFMEKPGIEPATPGLQDIGLSPTPRRLHLIPTTGGVFIFTSRIKGT